MHFHSSLGPRALESSPSDSEALVQDLEAGFLAASSEPAPGEAVVAQRPETIVQALELHAVGGEEPIDLLRPGSTQRPPEKKEILATVALKVMSQPPIQKYGILSEQLSGLSPGKKS